MTTNVIRENEANSEKQQTESNAGRQDAGGTEDYSLDAILVRIGQFGRYQIINYVLLCLPMIFNALFSISYVFTASPVVHRCNITQCDDSNSAYLEPWVNFTIPMKGSSLDQCNRYVTRNSSTSHYSFIAPSFEFCEAEYFDHSVTEKCGKDFKFRDQEFTIANEFGFFCSEEWKLSMVGTINNVGQFVGIPLGGFIADRFGRRTMLAAAGFLSAIMGVLRSLSTNYYMFLAFEFLDMAVGSTLFPTSFLLAIELVGPQRRVAAATIITIFYSLGEALLGVLAQQFQNWRVLLRVIYVPSALHILFLWILPESIRWLLSQGKEEKAVKVLKKAAKINKRDIPEECLVGLVQGNRAKLEMANESQFPIMKAIRLFYWRILNCCFCWFTHTLVALGLSLTSVNLGGNKYTNFMLNGVVQVPGLIVPLVLMDRIGRRFSLCGSMLMCAICMGATALIGNNNYSMELTLFLIGKFAITCSFQILYFFTSEIFPTNVRNSLLSFCSMVGRIGSMLAPQTPLLANYYEYAPQLLFASFALASGLLTLLFPETTDKVLPTTMEEASNLSDKKVPARRAANAELS